MERISLDTLDFDDLAIMPLFQGVAPDEVRALLAWLNSRADSFAEGEAVMHRGEQVSELGLVMDGSITVESTDLWGSRALFARVGPRRVFAEAYACVPGEPLMVDVIAAEPTRVLFVDVARVMGGGPGVQAQAPAPDIDRALTTVSRNLLRTLAHKSLLLARRAANTTPKTIRGKVLSYLSDQALHAGAASFRIPLNRQRLADYLGVDRSALSAELSRMRADGLIDYRLDSFRLLRDPSR